MTESAIARIWANAERPDKRTRTRSEPVLSDIPCRTGCGRRVEMARIREGLSPDICERCTVNLTLD